MTLSLQHTICLWVFEKRRTLHFPFVKAFHA